MLLRLESSLGRLSSCPAGSCLKFNRDDFDELNRNDILLCVPYYRKLIIGPDSQTLELPLLVRSGVCFPLV